MTQYEDRAMQETREPMRSRGEDYWSDSNTTRDASPVEQELGILREELGMLHDQVKNYVERTSIALQPEMAQGELSVAADPNGKGRPQSRLVSELQDLRWSIKRIQSTVVGAASRLDV